MIKNIEITKEETEVMKTQKIHDTILLYKITNKIAEIIEVINKKIK